MPTERPHLPKAVRRAVLVEAGHRCAIPTCRAVPVEIAHIVARASGGTDESDNLISLCPTCHTRFDASQIDLTAMRQYKANLWVINGRYGDVERRLLDHFASDPASTLVWLPPGHDIQVEYLVRDGLLAKTGRVLDAYTKEPGVRGSEQYHLTQPGQAFIASWSTAQPLR